MEKVQAWLVENRARGEKPRSKRKELLDAGYRDVGRIATVVSRASTGIVRQFSSAGNGYAHSTIRHAALAEVNKKTSELNPEMCGKEKYYNKDDQRVIIEGVILKYLFEKVITQAQANLWKETTFFQANLVPE